MTGTSGNAPQLKKHTHDRGTTFLISYTIGALPLLLATIIGRHVIRPSTNYLGGSFRPVWSFGLYGVGHDSQLCNKLGEHRLVRKSHTQSSSARPSTSAGTKRRR